MKIAVTGSTGLIGSALVTALRQRGHGVLRLVRRAPAAPDEAQWDPARGTVDMARFVDTQAVFHLAGAGVGDHRWTDAYKQEILNSRVEGTRTISAAIASLPTPAVAFICGSAIGFYGDTADRAVDESAPQGAGFLAGVVGEWEKSAAAAIDAGVPTAFARTGLVVSGDGGAWAKLFPIFKAGLGGRVGSGSQYWSFISLRDEVAALVHLLENPMSGPVNLTAPTPVTNKEVTAAMGRVLGRPTVLPVPAFALKAVLGEFSQDVLGSQRVIPALLESRGFVWQDADIDTAIRSALAS